MSSASTSITSPSDVQLLPKRLKVLVDLLAQRLGCLEVDLARFERLSERLVVLVANLDDSGRSRGSTAG